MKHFLVILAMLAFATSAFADAPASTKAERNLVREGNERFKAGNYHEALSFYEQALVANPQSLTAQFNKAVTLTNLSSDDNKGTENDPRVAAAQIFKDIARLDADPMLAAKSFYNLGNMAYNDADYGQAVEMYKGSLRIDPDNHQTRQNLRLAQLQLQQQEQNQDQQDQQDEKEQEQQQQEQQQEQQQQEQQQQQQQQQMTGSAQQILQTMQNKENATRRKVQEQEAEPVHGRRTTDKPW